MPDLAVVGVPSVYGRDCYSTVFLRSPKVVTAGIAYAG